MKDMIVSELLNKDGTSWNSGMVRGVFVDEKAKLIMSIPLSFKCMRDRCLWWPSKDMKYTVKSVYQLLHGHHIPCAKSTMNLWACVEVRSTT